MLAKEQSRNQPQNPSWSGKEEKPDGPINWEKWEE